MSKPFALLFGGVIAVILLGLYNLYYDLYDQRGPLPLSGTQARGIFRPGVIFVTVGWSLG